MTAATLASPYECCGPLEVHTVTSDNPRRTGRCLSCRAFVTRGRKGWRRASVRQAQNLGLLQRRADSR